MGVLTTEDNTKKAKIEGKVKYSPSAGKWGWQITLTLPARRNGACGELVIDEVYCTPEPLKPFPPITPHWGWEDENGDTRWCEYASLFSYDTAEEAEKELRLVMENLRKKILEVKKRNTAVLNGAGTKTIVMEV